MINLGGYGHMRGVTLARATDSVRNRFIGSWSHGFEVAERVQGGYRVRRLSDNSVLPDIFSTEDVRSERRKQGLWWY